MAARGLLVLCPLVENAGVFGRDVKAKSFIKGLKKSNQSSKHPSRRLVTELRILTLLIQSPEQFCCPCPLHVRSVHFSVLPVRSKFSWPVLLLLFY